MYLWLNGCNCFTLRTHAVIAAAEIQNFHWIARGHHYKDRLLGMHVRARSFNFHGNFFAPVQSS